VAEPYEEPRFYNAVEHTVAVTFTVRGGKRHGTADRQARKIAERLGSRAARMVGVVEVRATAGPSRDGTITSARIVRFDAANAGQAIHGEADKLDRYLDPDHELALRSLAAANAAAQDHRRVDQERRLAAGCRNTYQHAATNAFCECVYCKPELHYDAVIAVRSSGHNRSSSTAASAVTPSTASASAAPSTARRQSSSSTTTHPRSSCSPTHSTKRSCEAPPATPLLAHGAAPPAPRDSRATRATQTGTSCAAGWPVLNIGRLAPGGEGYYLDTVAAGVEDYYTGAGEAPGHWLTETAAGLGLTGWVGADDLRAVLGARDPSDPKDTLVSGRGGRKVPGFDLAFRAPKSVSLVWALGDEATAAVIRDAHDQAVRAAIGYLERHAARSRRGAQGHDRIAMLPAWGRTVDDVTKAVMSSLFLSTPSSQ